MAPRTRAGFDSVATAAARGHDTVVTRLGALPTNGVSCHAMYRLAAR